MPGKTPDAVCEAILLAFQNQIPIMEIARRFEISHTTVRRIVDPKYRDAKRADDKHYREKTRAGVGPIHFVKKMPSDAERNFHDRIPDVPDDTRDLTARLLGDPLPGRSALDQRRMQQEA